MEISAATPARGRPLYHIMKDLSMGNLYKKSPAQFVDIESKLGGKVII